MAEPAAAAARLLDRADADWPALDRLLDAALDLDEPRRSGWLAALPDSTERMLLEQLLRPAGRGARTQDFLATLPPLSAAALARIGDSDAPSGALQPGDEVGPWRIVRELGRGGMGAVWLAERSDGTLKRQVALKLPHATWLPGLALRLQRERDILAQLEHPNIARLYDAGVDALGRPWLALEVVQGRPIDDFVEAERCDLRTRIRLVVQVARAVAFAHSRLVIHRDLKPSNILVSADARVHLLDFGIAKLLHDERAEETALTLAAGRVLTPRYASPEQVRGDALSTASDVYSLAVIAFELLTGEAPYRLKRGSAAELEEAITTAEPPRASDVANEPLHRRQLRGEVDAILARALHKDVAARYPTMAAFADDLERHLEGQPVLARPDSGWARAWRLVRRHKLPVAAAAVVVLALGAGLGMALWQAANARASLADAQIALNQEGAVRSFYQQLTPEIVATGGADPKAVAQLFVRKLDEYEQRGVAGNPELLQALTNAVAQQLTYLQANESALAVAQRQLALLKRHPSRDPDHLMTAYQNIGSIQLLLRRAADAEGSLREALATVPHHDRNINSGIQTRLYLSRALTLQDRRPEALAELARAMVELDAFRARNPGSQRDTAYMSVRLMAESARVDLDADDPGALRRAREAVAAMKAPVYLRDAARHDLLFTHARALFNTGHAAEAEAVVDELVQRMQHVRDTGWLAAAGTLQAAAIAAQARYAEAKRSLASVLPSLWANVQAGPASLAATSVERALQVEQLHGDTEAAGSLLAEYRRLHGSDKPADARVLAHEARWLVDTQRQQQAVDRLSTWLQAASATPRAHAPAQALRIALAEAQLAAGQADAALATLRSLLDDMRTTATTATWRYRHATEAAAVAHAERGDAAAGLALLDQLDASAAAAELQAPSRAERADSALRRATVALAAGRRDQAAALLRAAEADLEGQHAASPRLAAARRLQAALAAR